MHRTRLRIALSLVSSVAAATAASVWDGAYSKEQAARGKTGYSQDCARCHGENLAGGEGAPALAGREFVEKWSGRSVGDLLELVRKTMPTDDPGNLSRRAYADMVAYILAANDFPAGAKDMPADATSLNGIAIEKKK